ncbi:MAG: hypothetical protein ACJ72J_15740, partial [Nitrososphaeraceae archaeon]
FFFFFVISYSSSQAVPIVGKSTKRKNPRIQVLERRISYLERYPRSISAADTNNVIKQLKEKLAQLEAEENKMDKLRRLPLYSSKITL